MRLCWCTARVAVGGGQIQCNDLTSAETQLHRRPHNKTSNGLHGVRTSAGPTAGASWIDNPLTPPPSSQNMFANMLWDDGNVLSGVSHPSARCGPSRQVALHNSPALLTIRHGGHPIVTSTVCAGKPMRLISPFDAASHEHDLLVRVGPLLEIPTPAWHGDAASLGASLPVML